ncbi:hypothetical protein [Kiloniella laminariae]|uniref:hypothetical protein n=1 Tax=Kiloniella laminariae TaxID=454162 RepID=UPI00037481A9|nr:hypothetical protein [Kiloniella laminariae]
MDCNPGEHWQEYFLEDYDADESANNLRLTGIKERFLSPDENVLLSPVILGRKETGQACRDLQRLGQLLQEMPELFFHSDMTQWALALGYSSEQAAFLTGTLAGRPPAFGRWDILPSIEGWKIIEFNSGGAVSGLDCDAMQDLYDVLLSEQLAEYLAGHDVRGGNALDALGELVAKLVAGRELSDVVVVDDDQQYRNSPFSADGAAQVLARILNRQVRVEVASKFEPASKGVTLVFEVFTLRDVAARPELYHRYLSAVGRQDVLSVNPLATDLLMSKAGLAVLYEQARKGSLTPADQDLVLKYIPETYCVTSDLLAREGGFDREKWVLKAAIGYGGMEVFCGWEQTEARWQELLEEAANGEVLFVLQKRVQPVKQTVVAMTPQGDFIERQEAPVLGIFIREGQFSGGLARAGIGNSAVVNAHNHAAVGVMRLEQE